MVEDDKYVELFKQAIKTDFEYHADIIIKETEKKLREVLIDTTNKVINRFVGNIYFERNDNPKHSRPQITISFNLGVEEKV